MAKQIGFDNNPTGSAVALGLGQVFKDWALKHTSGKANNLISKISTKSIGKALIYANIANAANQTVADFLPHVNAAITWVGALPANILNQTLGRIPVLGNIFRVLHNWITEAVSTIADFIGLDAIAATGRTFKLSDPNSGFETQIDWKSGKTGLDLPEEKGEDEMKTQVKSQPTTKVTTGKVNHPSFYEKLDLHKTFSIPQGYTKKTVVNGTMGTPKLIAHRLSENPVPDKSAMIDRYTQKFALIKATRGLSATNYTIVDLFNYERLCKLALHEYYSIKRIVQAAKTYNLVQVEIGNNIISALGYVPSEVRSNLANYETLLCQYHRFISNSMPMTGQWIERLAYLKEVFIPDYSDAKIATYHMYTICMADVFYDPTNPTASLVFDEIPEAGNNNYAVMVSNLAAIQACLVNNNLWQQLIADYQGAFGSISVWNDKSYPEYKEPINLANGNNDLNREQIKNAFYLDAKITCITTTPGKPNAKASIDVDKAVAVRLPNYQFGGTFDATSFANVSTPTYDTILAEDTYLGNEGKISYASEANNLKLLIPDLNGVGAQSYDISDFTSDPWFVSMNNHETIYSMHKDNYSEGEALEISQFKCRSIGVRVGISDANDLNFSIFYKTQEYALSDSTAYVFGSNGSAIVAQTYELCNETFSDDALQNSESPIDFPDEMMIWALTDWMPFMHVTFFGYNSTTAEYSPRDILLIDMDSFGSLDDRAFSTSVNYSIYSLYGANLRVGKKRIDNINDVYQSQRKSRTA